MQDKRRDVAAWAGGLGAVAGVLAGLEANHGVLSRILIGLTTISLVILIGVGALEFSNSLRTLRARHRNVATASPRRRTSRTGLSVAVLALAGIGTGAYVVASSGHSPSSTSPETPLSRSPSSTPNISAPTLSPAPLSLTLRSGFPRRVTNFSAVPAPHGAFLATNGTFHADPPYVFARGFEGNCDSGNATVAWRITGLALTRYRVSFPLPAVGYAKGSILVITVPGEKPRNFDEWQFFDDYSKRSQTPPKAISLGTASVSKDGRFGSSMTISARVVPVDATGPCQANANINIPFPSLRLVRVN
jgi:hypothetical protein